MRKGALKTKKQKRRNFSTHSHFSRDPDFFRGGGEALTLAFFVTLKKIKYTYVPT